ncbi:hypothetical protein Pam4_16 [Pseudanabaena phage Pam4]|nr:hypothetical protein Pam4_16 [Pseudanabaena phage Pam4]
MTTYTQAPQTGEYVGAEYHAAVTREVSLREVGARGGRITRLRLLTEVIPGRGRCADVSYVHATLNDGEVVRVSTGSLDLHLTPMRQVKVRLIEWARAEAVYAKGLGLLDEGNWSVM